MLRTARSLPLHRAFDTGLRRQAFPPDVASLLPGLLAATRTGLAPAGDDELTNLGHLHEATSVPLGARTIRVRFAPRLSEMSSTQARIVNHLCSTSKKVLVGVLRQVPATGRAPDSCSLWAVWLGNTRPQELPDSLSRLGCLGGAERQLVDVG
jgi:hypothetical protein